MPKKFSAKINESGSGTFTDVYVEANSRFDAERLLKAQYPNYNIHFLQEVESPQIDEAVSTGAGSSKSGCASIAVLLVAALAYGAWQSSTSDMPVPDKVPETAGINNTDATLNDDDQTLPPVPTEDSPSEQILPTEQFEPTTPPIETTSEQIEQNVPIDIKQEPREIIPSGTEDITRLRNYEITIETPTGDQRLKVSAKSIDDARRIMRDFRGNPVIVSVSEWQD